MAPSDETHLLSDGTRDVNRDASGHAAFIPTGATESRRIPPSGRVSPDGKRIWPQPSRSSQMIVYGSIALAAAGGTAGLLLLLDKLTDKPEQSAAKRMEAAEQLPPRQPQRKKKRRSQIGIMEFATTVRDATALLSAAMVGFKTVAQYADGITKQFHEVADSINKTGRPHHADSNTDQQD